MSQPQSPYGDQPANLRPDPALSHPGPPHPGPSYPVPPAAGQHYAPVYTEVFRKQTGMVFMAQTTQIQATGTYPEIRSAFWKAQTHCLLLGWWGVLSLLLYNWMALGQNISALSRVKRQARANGDL